MKQILFTALMTLLIGIFVVPLVLYYLTGGKEETKQESFVPIYAEMNSPAPSLKMAQWIKNGPVDVLEGRGKQVYVIEFWATWCPPCRESIPNLTRIQQKYRGKGVVVVGITDEPPAEVRKFVNSMGSQMGYAVGVDRDGETHRAYLRPFQVNTIPHAFVIDRDGMLVWHGNPLMGLEVILDRYVD